MEEPVFTHLNSEGRARMVDVTEKEITCRRAVARAVVTLNIKTFELLRAGALKKGDALAVAQVAGILAAKKTAELIPMCHPVAITGADLSFDLDAAARTVTIHASVTCKGETGVEMEALTAVSTAALTIYDMCKAVQRDILIGDVRLISKSGGKSGEYFYN